MDELSILFARISAPAVLFASTAYLSASHGFYYEGMGLLVGGFIGYLIVIAVWNYYDRKRDAWSGN